MKEIPPPREPADFFAQRRTVLLAHPEYKKQLEGFIEGLEVHQEVPVETHLGQGKDDQVLGPLSMSLAVLADDMLGLVHLLYSAGEPVHALREQFGTTIAVWSEYAALHDRFHRSPAAPYRAPHLDLGDRDYWKALRLASFALLLGNSELLPQIASLWDYENEELDGLLERLIAPFVPNRAQPPDTCTRHLPYFKLLKVFTADPTKRPTLMAKYLDEWYTASRREPYFNSHTKGRDHSFLGYWSFEAAAVAYVLDIDDTSFREHEFYPKDLADFAKALQRPTEIGGVSTPIAGPTDRLRCIAGQACPREGMWFTPARADSRRHFASGEVMPEIGGSFGATIWQYDPSGVS